MSCASPSTADDAFAARLLRWFDVSGRHDLPWQHPRTPYRVWLSEVMLQQTQVRVVVPYFLRFVDALPTLRDLAGAEPDTVLALWSGLGYYTRARNLHAAARLCVERHGAELPRDRDALVALPGVGRSTAAAILSQAWGARHAILDGNVKRVLARYHGVAGWPGLPAVEKRLWSHAEAHLPQARMADYTQAQMDLGATVCTRADPACILCPLQADCVARLQGRTAELPTPRPGKAPPHREATVLWLEDALGRVLLQRRPPTGVWASLWSLPQFDGGDDARAWLGRYCNARFDDATPLPPVEHGFSHYALTLHPRRLRGIAADGAIADDADLRWIAPGELLAYGIPAPIRRLLANERRTDLEK